MERAYALFAGTVMAQDRVSPGRQGRQSLSFWGQAGETYLGLMADLGLMVPLAFSRQVHTFHRKAQFNFPTGKNIFPSWIFIFSQLGKFCEAFSRIKTGFLLSLHWPEPMEFTGTRKPASLSRPFAWSGRGADSFMLACLRGGRRWDYSSACLRDLR